MKHIVLTILGMWFAFVSVAQTLKGWETILVPAHFSSQAIGIIALHTLIIGFGYSLFLVEMVDASIRRLQAVTICIGWAFLVAIISPLLHWNWLIGSTIWWGSIGTTFMILFLTRRRKV